MWELGFLDRASALVRMRAIDLLERIEYDPIYCQEREVVHQARVSDIQWYTMVFADLTALKIPAPTIGLLGDTPKQTRLKRYARENR